MEYKEAGSLLKFIVKRLLSAIPVLIVIITVVFFLMRILPGDPATLILGDEAKLEDIEQLREAMGLNKPVFVQYVSFIKDLFFGNWGTSLYNGQSVIKNIVARAEPTVLLMLYSTIVSVIIGIPIGILSAIKRNSILDYSLMTVSVFGLSIPMFWMAMMLSYWVGVRLGWLPTQNYITIAQGGLKQALTYLTMPALAIGFQSISSNARYMRSTMLDVLNNDYLRTARAKGLAEKVVIYKHALKNALSPVVTHIGLGMAIKLGGAIVVETVFNIQGMGKLSYDSLMRRDYTQVQANILVVAMIYVFVNIILDILYKVLDPKIELD